MTRRELLAAGVAIASASIRPAFTQETLDPVKLMPHTHKLLFENEFVRVVESRVPPGATEPKHVHPHCVTVHLVDVDAEVKTFPDGRITRVHNGAGTADWSEATTHEVKNIGTITSHNFRVELKQRSLTA
jgi:hypothetical protein